MKNADTVSPYASWGRRIGASLAWLVMALVFAITGWLFGLKPVVATVGNWNTARDYQPVQATVVERTGSDEGGNFTWYAAQYSVEGKTYQTSRMTILDDDMIDEPANDAVQKALANARRDEKAVTVWVSPRRPDVALASVELPLKSLWLRTPMAVVFTIIALAGALGAVGALANLAYYRRMHDASGSWVFSALWCGLIFPMLTLVMTQSGVEGFAIGVIGVFAAIGAMLLLGAISASISGTGGMTVSGFGSGSKKSNLTKAQLATSWGPKGNPVKGSVKRGGIGGRGADFDKD